MSGDRRIFDLWLACHTQEEIAATVGISQGEVAKNIPNGNLAEWHISEAQRAAAAHATDFEPPLAPARVLRDAARSPSKG